MSLIASPFPYPPRLISGIRCRYDQIEGGREDLVLVLANSNAAAIRDQTYMTSAVGRGTDADGGFPKSRQSRGGCVNFIV